MFFKIKGLEQYAFNDKKGLEPYVYKSWKDLGYMWSYYFLMLKRTWALFLKIKGLELLMTSNDEKTWFICFSKYKGLELFVF